MLGICWAFENTPESRTLLERARHGSNAVDAEVRSVF
jgi:hypothetical protein